jgi:hypothetical protein
MKVQKITIDSDPYEPLRLAQGYRAGELLFISARWRSTGTDSSSASATSMPRRNRSLPTSSGFSVPATSLYSPEALIEIEAIAVADAAVEGTEGRSGRLRARPPRWPRRMRKSSQDAQKGPAARRRPTAACEA